YIAFHWGRSKFSFAVQRPRRTAASLTVLDFDLPCSNPRVAVGLSYALAPAPWRLPLAGTTPGAVAVFGLGAAAVFGLGAGVPAYVLGGSNAFVAATLGFVAAFQFQRFCRRAVA